jgi:hypothetical protein
MVIVLTYEYENLFILYSIWRNETKAMRQYIQRIIKNELSYNQCRRNFHLNPIIHGCYDYSRKCARTERRQAFGSAQHAVALCSI